jgi:archaemetzincin
MKSFLFYLFIFFFCYHTYAQSNNVFKKLINKQKLTIVIQPFDKFPQASAKYIANQVKKVYSGSVVVFKPIKFPINSLNSTRSRYRADSLIRILSKNTSSGFLTIGLTNKDISTTKGKHQDWGNHGAWILSRKIMYSLNI